MSQAPFHKLTTFLKHLEQANIYYTLASHRDDAIMVLVTVPGERWEIEFFGNGSIEVERFISNGEICGEETLHELLARYADQEQTEVV
jgi:hypothetical protein